MFGRLLLGGSGFLAAALQLAALVSLRRRAADSATGAASAPDFALPTCPAACPPPSLAFCAGPLLDTVERWVDLVGESGFLDFAFYLALVAFGAFLGRATVRPEAPAVRPDARRRPSLPRGP